MFLSKLTLNPRSRGVLHDLNDFYELHRTLLRAFSETASAESGLLYRIDTDRRTGIPTVLVQSASSPDWSYLISFDSYLLSPPENKEINLAFKTGQLLHFRLRANPTRRLFKECDRSKKGAIKGLFKPEEQEQWLQRKGDTGGFQVISMTIIPEGKIIGKKEGETLTLYAVKYEGVLRVTDKDKFSKTILDGIGRGKRFGFGLLSVAPFSGA